MKVRKRVTLMVITVSVIFGVCWLTDSISYWLRYYTPTHTLEDVIHATTIMIMLNSAINPFVYALMNQRFREKIKDMMCCTCGHTNRIYAVRESRAQRMETINSHTSPFTTETTGRSSKE